MISLDLFAGLGGWDSTVPGILGVEHDKWACATREAAGLRTLQADIALLDANDWPCSDLLVASPPCQGFSVAGKRDPNDPRNFLVLEPMRWTRLWRPKFIAFEQVPPVLPIWENYASDLRRMGYSTWTGVLSAEMYGVPQTRKRAILMASTEKEVRPPAPTHSRYYPRDPKRFDEGVLPWVSMAEALAWEGARTVRTRALRKATGGNLFDSEQPSWTLTEKARSWTTERPAPTLVTSPRSDEGLIVGRQLPEGEERDPTHGGWTLRTNRDGRQDGTRQALPTHLPAPTLSGKSGSQMEWAAADRVGLRTNAKQGEGVRITLAEALILQGFPPDYPVQGAKTRQFLQVGNAIPPPLAAAILRELLSSS